MTVTVAVIAAGQMGAGVGARLTENGAHVLTLLDGRSAASAARAAAAGMTGADDAAIAEADFVLSIVPPAQSLPLAERLRSALAAGARKPVYVDCNAVSPATAAEVADVIAATGCRFADGGIIGGPPSPGTAGPRIYVSGPEAPSVEVLIPYGLDIRCMHGAIGEASALKMSYGGLTKGLTALGAALTLAASRAGIDGALRAELADSQPQMLAFLSRFVPSMYSKSYRWVAEMDEVSAFLGDRAEADIYRGAAGLYTRLAEDFDGPQEEIALLRAFFDKR